MIPMTRKRRAGHIVRPVSSSRSARPCREIARVRRVPERSGRLFLAVSQKGRAAVPVPPHTKKARKYVYRKIGAESGYCWPESCPQAVSGSLICEIADNVFNLREIVFSDMKKIVWLAIPIALSLLSCSKDEPQNDGRLEVKLYAYMLDEAGRNAKKTSAHFYFFDASDGQQFVEERIDIPSGTEEDYRNANLTVLRMLLRDNEFPLTDGTSAVPLVVDRNEFVEGNKYVLVMPDYRHPDTWDPYRSHHSIRVEPGEYYVVALFGDYHHRWPCQQKYTGKYLTVSRADKASRILTVDFPNDPTYKGYFDWQGEIREPADSLRFEF